MVVRTLLLALFSLWLCSPVVAGEVRLSAAASMTHVTRELLAAFRQHHQGTMVIGNFAGSGSLAKQIDQGAPVDFYISANQHWLEYLVSRDRISSSSVTILASNQLVFVGQPDLVVTSIVDVGQLSLVAIGSPRNVPAGRYTAQALKATGLYAKMTGEHRLIMTKDVRQALLYAERGEVDGAFVYKTDGLLAQQSKLHFEVPADLHDPIIYSMGLTELGVKNEAAQALLFFLRSREAQEILRSFGFTIP